MAWTLPTALFFVGIASAIAVMTAAEIKWPGRERRGFLPMVTSRGDRFFISLLAAAWIHLFWLGLVSGPVTGATVIAVAVGAVIMRWG